MARLNYNELKVGEMYLVTETQDIGSITVLVRLNPDGTADVIKKLKASGAYCKPDYTTFYIINLYQTYETADHYNKLESLDKETKEWLS